MFCARKLEFDPLKIIKKKKIKNKIYFKGCNIFNEFSKGMKTAVFVRRYL